MCGIIGYSGHQSGVPIVIEGLKRLEYRGYDSSGISFVHDRALQVIRAQGKLKMLEEKLAQQQLSPATTAVGHTRWATHGAPTEFNAHPHKSSDGKLCLVHNGIIENFQECKTDLEKKGYTFTSQTDSEVLVNLIADQLQPNVPLLQAFANALKQAKGTFAIALISKDEPNTIYAARQLAPLLLGIGNDEHFVASDVTAFLPRTNKVVFLEDGEIIRITPNTWEVFSMSDLTPKAKTVEEVSWDMQSAEKGGFPHFMLKEIFEQPAVITNCMATRVDAETGEILIPELEKIAIPSRLRIVACGTSYHAGLWARQLIEEWAHIPTEVEIATEYRYRNPLVDPNETVMVITQSGETADTLAAMRIAKDQGCTILGLCNVVGSSIARESSSTIYTQAGPEISVASTKALISQIAILMLMALYWGKKKGTVSQDLTNQALTAFADLPNQLGAALPALHEEAKKLAQTFGSSKDFYVLGRGLSYPLALEGALKIKETSYIHAEGYSLGELKHGPIALVDSNFPSIALAPHDALFLKSKSNIEEIQARQGRVIALTNPAEDGMELRVEHQWVIPATWGPLASFLFLPALQLLSYEIACSLGKDVDQPRNLAKSVTVE